MYQLEIFDYRNQQKIRTVEIDGEVWFVANDVCAALGLENVSKALIGIDNDDKRDLTKGKVPGVFNKLRAINESGIYHLIFKSRKPEAKRFKRWVTQEVLPQIRKTGSYGTKKTESYLPDFIRRANDNWMRIEPGYFSVISELMVRVYSKLEYAGYKIPDISKTGERIRPDVSVGQLFPKWLAEKSPDMVDLYKNYPHSLDGIEVPARQYKNDVLPLFIEYVETVWLVERAESYFKVRAPKVLEYLPKLIPGYATKKKKLTKK